MASEKSQKVETSEVCDDSGSDDDVAEDIRIKIKKGLNIGELRQENGTTFEVDVDNMEEVERYTKTETNAYFDQEDVFKYSKFQETHGGGSDTESGEDTDDLSPFEKLGRKMEDITEEKNGGVLKKVLTPGHGPVCPEEASVLVHFNGYLEYKDEPFDSSRLRNKPDRIKLGDCILGWTIGIKTMKKGELSRFIIRSDYGWGPQGCPPRIPEDSTVMFEIELIEAFARAGVDDYESTPMSERKFLPFEKIYMAAHSAKDEAKTHYHNGHYRQASRKYEKAIRILEECCLRNDDEERKQQEMLKTLYLNCATCKDKLSSPKPVITLCNKALEIDKDSVKAYYLLGVAYLRLGDFTASRKKLMVARKLKPQFKCVSKALAELESVEKQLRNEEAAMYKRMISGAGKNEENETGRSATQRTNFPPDSVDQLDPEYKANIKTRIQAFKHNQDLDSLDIGSLGMTPVEIAYIIDLAEELGIEWKEYGTGESYQVKLVKS